MMSNAAVAPRIFTALRALNIGLHIDDFGTGYSSLSMLHHFPIDALKIDRSFIARLGTDGEGAEIVQTVIALAQSLNMDVVAEGIETSEQCSYLRKLGCNYGQGYLFAKPLESSDAGEMVSSGDLTLGQSQVA
jgi:EAL domain-containing protein (putative c-di-GMP-specific phosphodiesterase class I)